MTQTVNQTIYKAFGLSIRSDIPLPELRPADDTDAGADIAIRYADLTERWTRLFAPPSKFVATNNLVMFRIPDAAIFAIEDGASIYISPEKDADEDKIRLFVLGTCMGALLLQKKILPLHGSAIVIDNKAYAIVGHSGHGKSTLASALLQRGFRLLTDDVIAVTLDQQQNPSVLPAYPQQKLWQESLHEFGMDASQYRPLFERETKYAVPVTTGFAEETVPLAGVFELMKTDGEQIELRKVEKLERLPLLHRHTYRGILLQDSGLLAWHFDTTARLAERIDVYQLRRPIHALTVRQLSDRVISAVRTRE